MVGPDTSKGGALSPLPPPQALRTALKAALTKRLASRAVFLDGKVFISAVYWEKKYEKSLVSMLLQICRVFEGRKAWCKQSPYRGNAALSLSHW
jgi:hypothetical protein